MRIARLGGLGEVAVPCTVADFNPGGRCYSADPATNARNQDYVASGGIVRVAAACTEQERQPGGRCWIDPAILSAAQPFPNRPDQTTLDIWGVREAAAAAAAGGALPAGTAPTLPAASIIPGIDNTTLMVVGAVVVVGIIIIKRRAKAKRTSAPSPGVSGLGRVRGRSRKRKGK